MRIEITFDKLWKGGTLPTAGSATFLAVPEEHEAEYIKITFTASEKYLEYLAGKQKLGNFCLLTLN